MNGVDIECLPGNSDVIEQENSIPESAKRLITLDSPIPSKVISLFGWAWAMIVIIIFNVGSNSIAW